MPFLDSMCDKAAVFDNAYAEPLCTPTRSSMLTGRYPFRTGAGNVRQLAGQVRLALDEPSIPKIARQAGISDYRMAAFGKWHLSDEFNGGRDSPRKFGFDDHIGFIQGGETVTGNNVYKYFDFGHVVNGVQQARKVGKYKTTFLIDELIAYTRRHQQPIFGWVGFVAPHLPWVKPPEHLHSFWGLEDPPEWPKSNKPLPAAKPYFAAMLQALDTEIKRFVAWLEKNTKRPAVVIFIGDNGTSGEVARDNSIFPEYRYKGGAFYKGTHVPFIVFGVNGYQVRSGRIAGQVHAVDIFPTVLQLMGVGGDIQSLDKKHKIDGISFLPALTGTEAFPGRDYIYVESEREQPNTKFHHAIQGKAYRLNIFYDFSLDYHHYVTDPHERFDLLHSSHKLTAAEKEALNSLLSELERLWSSEPSPHIGTTITQVRKQVDRDIQAQQGK